MADNIIQKISQKYEEISESDLDDWVVPGLIEHYRHRINFLASKAYRSGTTGLAQKAFEEQAKKKLGDALETFILKKQYWKEGRDLGPYLLKSLKILSTEIAWDQDVVKKKNMPVCPACRCFGNREFLNQENKMLRCASCTKEIERLSKEVESAAHLQPKFRLCSVFSLHSRKGYKCPECTKFIPASAASKNGISCPYVDCLFFGSASSLKEMSHPVGVSINQNVSLNHKIKDDSSQGGGEIQDFVESNSVMADDILEMRNRTQKEYDILMQVIQDQVACIRRTNSSSTLKQKLIMYEAFRLMIKEYPEEMVSYLVHRNQQSDFPIQTRIFQKYVSLMKDFLPFSIKKGKKKIDIVSLTDRNLALFIGISKYNAVVEQDGKIPNNTKENYVGARKYKDYGPCFIGYVIDVIDVERGISLRDNIVDYGFQHIMLDNSIEPGTKVKVSHFRIPSHYEMDSMVYLQRIRRQIVDAVYFRIHGHKRPTKKRKKK